MIPAGTSKSEGTKFALKRAGNPISLTPAPATLEYGNPGGTQMGSDGGSRTGGMELLAVGIVLVTCVVLGYVLGDLVDDRWGSKPWGSVVGVMLGTGAGILNLFRTVTRSQR